jgi:murein DD-endopeptidase MepM/ murein hydrolase activator NlpD
MAEVKHTVIKGDTLSELAVRYGVTVADLVKLNHIQDPDFIVVGQELIITGEAKTTETNVTSTPTIGVFGLQSNTDRTVYVTWTWDKANTEHYQTMWHYDTGDGVWFVGNDSTTKHKQSTYNAPTNAKRVRFKVKPISKNKSTNGGSTSYWTAGWSTVKIYSFSDNPPKTPSAPTVEIVNYALTARLDNVDLNADYVQFQVVKDDSTTFKTSGSVKISTNSVSFSCNVAAGSEYKVRCRSVKGNLYSAWSPYSSNIETIPAAPTALTECRASSETSVYLAWAAVQSATSYDIEFATEKRYFDGSDQTTTVNNITSTHYEKTGLTSGDEYFFRVRAVNAKGSSGWSAIRSTIIGKKPAAPTTWSTTTTAISGEEVSLYWMHNTEDGSSQTIAELELIIDGVKETHTIRHSTSEEDKDKPGVYTLNTTGYTEGVSIQWRVRTAGITHTYGDWSVQRNIDIYAPPTLELQVTKASGEHINVLTVFPFYVRALAGPNTQYPIGYSLAIVSNEVYDTVDILGNEKHVNAGDTVYSKYFDTSEVLLVELSAGNIDLENNVSYTVKCSVSMNSGLTAEATSQLDVAWDKENHYEPNAEIGIDTDTYSACIRPYCEDIYGVPIEDIVLSVYRREFDGSFTELAKDIDNLANTFITDPHPALDYARYRVVAKTKSTGAISYYDVPGYPVGGKAVIIQWDEAWSGFDSPDEDRMEQPTWAGSMLKLPYNIDVTDNHKSDVALVEYIGRKHPVSYYGTQLGETSTWNVEVEKSDKETLYALRRLAIWAGDVYVREPSGSGYWANVTVSFSQKHCELTVPVTIEVVRVEGGI